MRNQLSVFTNPYALAQAVAAGHQAVFGRTGGKSTFVVIEEASGQSPWHSQLGSYEDLLPSVREEATRLFQRGLEEGWAMVDERQLRPRQQFYQRFNTLYELAIINIPNPPVRVLECLGEDDVWSFLIAHSREHGITLRLNVIGDRQF